MPAIRAIVVDPEAPGRLVLREVDAPAPSPAEALIQVAAISLNPGETRRAMAAAVGWRPGWDLAGTVIRPAADGSGPPAGARVVGLVPSGGWAEQVAVRAADLASLPAAVSFAQAATLPVAGLTALRALERGPGLLGRRVLVTAASGGVGFFACQLARIGGAHVVGVVRRPERIPAAIDAGAHEVVLDADLEKAAGALGPYDIAVESVGGTTLPVVLRLLAPRGVCVTLGASGGADVTFNLREFFALGGATLSGFHLIQDMTILGNPVGPDLARLAALVADGRLQTPIEVEAPWTEIADQARRLLERDLTGKAVLRVGNGQ